MSWEFKCPIAPSIMAVNYLRVKEEINECVQAGVSVLHLDVMDNTFVPNLTFGPDFVKHIRPLFQGTFDAHLMLENPWDIAKEFVKSGVDHITIHAEVSQNLTKDIEKIKNLGVSCGVAVKPKTPVESILPFLDQLDLVLVMSVEPGFYGQKFIPDVLDKVRTLVKHRNGRAFKIQIDGGINTTNISECAEAGVELFVAGSAAFSGSIKDNIQNLQSRVK